jgi:hypothetical protein
VNNPLESASPAVEWADAPVYIVGGGPSLLEFDFSGLAGRGHVLGVNQAMFDAPCEAGITVDHEFLQRNTDKLRWFSGRAVLYLAISERWAEIGLPQIAGAVYLRHTRPGHITRGPTSGDTALHLAILKGAKRIVLLGFDYGVIPGHHHYHSEYSWYHLANTQSWRVWATEFERLARLCSDLGVEVVNASAKSVIPYFPRMTVGEAMKRW